MATADDDTLLDARLRIMRIIVFALVQGLVIFLAIAFYQRSTGAMPPAPDVPILTYVGLALAAIMVVVQVFVPNLVSRAAVRKMNQERQASDPAQPNPGKPLTPSLGTWCGLYQTRLIVGASLLEGAAFFLLIAYLMEGSWLTLGAAVLLIAALAVKFPSRTGVEGWITAEQEALLQECTGI